MPTFKVKSSEAYDCGYRVLLLDGNRGIYLPQQFARLYADQLEGIDPNEGDIPILMEGPDNEYYWDSWDSVLLNGCLRGENGALWILEQDDDLWATCVADASGNTIEIIDDDEWVYDNDDEDDEDKIFERPSEKYMNELAAEDMEE